MSSAARTWLLALAALAPAAVAALADPRPPVQDERDRHFEHTDHVSRQWLSRNETWRDCRGCHDYTGDRESPPRIGDPMDKCASCHYRAEFTQTAAPGFEKGLGPLRERVAMAGFYHSEHLNLQCKTCHLPATQGAKQASRFARRNRGEVPAKMDVPRGFATCDACHDPSGGAPARELLPFGDDPPGEAEQLNDEFVRTLNDSAPMRPDALGPFLHADHMDDPRRAFALDEVLAADPRGRDCGACHQPVLAWEGADAPAGAEYSLEGCGVCHVSDAGRTPLEFGTSPRSGAVSEALGTFDHASHLGDFDPASGLASREAYEAIERQACVACHLYEYSDAVENYVVGGPLLGDERREPFSSEYEGCVECHAAWVVPIHDDWSRPSGPVEPGGPSLPGGCLECHVFGVGDENTPTDLGQARATAEVTRRRPTGFDVLSQAHDFITGGAREEACIDCHLATDVESLPSRVGAKPFNHATHLPPDPQPRHCIECHGATIAETTSSEEIGAALYPLLNADRLGEEEPRYGDRLVYAPDDPRGGLTYDPSSCDRCHVGAVLVPTFGPPRTGTVLRFPHDEHVELICSTCHIPKQSAGQAVDIGTDRAASDCSKCHDHGEQWQVTGLIRDDAVKRCSQCHVDTTGRIPAAGEEPYPIRRTTIATVSDATFHPAGAACDECHIAREWSSWPEDELGSEPFVSGVHGSGIHAPGDDGIPHKPADCLDCHWGSNDLEGHGGQDPTDLRLRAQLGGVIELGPNRVPYPGWRDRPR